MSERTELPTMRKRSGATSGVDQHGGVGGRVLLGDDLDPLEAVGQPRAGDLLLLVDEVALGDQHQPVGPAEGLIWDRVGDAVEQFDGVGEHGPLAQVDESAIGRGRRPPRRSPRAPSPPWTG